MYWSRSRAETCSNYLKMLVRIKFLLVMSSITCCIACLHKVIIFEFLPLIIGGSLISDRLSPLLPFYPTLMMVFFCSQREVTFIDDKPRTRLSMSEALLAQPFAALLQDLLANTNLQSRTVDCISKKPWMRTEIPKGRAICR